MENDASILLSPSLLKKNYQNGGHYDEKEETAQTRAGEKRKTR